MKPRSIMRAPKTVTRNDLSAFRTYSFSLKNPINRQLAIAVISQKRNRNIRLPEYAMPIIEPRNSTTMR